MGRTPIPRVPPPLALPGRASEWLKRRYVAGDLAAEEFERLVGIALEHGDPQVEPRPGGIRSPGRVEGEIEELGTPDYVVGVENPWAEPTWPDPTKPEMRG